MGVSEALRFCTNSFTLLHTDHRSESGSDSGGSISSTAGVYRGLKIAQRSADILDVDESGHFQAIVHVDSDGIRIIERE
ncbi:hypothetical protein NDU88_010026 [Pleurodeles waltl]|uniref:Uncharacterized protein n=1 Tax=Pleurodeles waltl TaxID=8319 RepID=A0AAV7QT96_PLEWA|nr:hypothetical protein NDU88_010026 [Pleurodeles waltl]